MIDQSLVPIPDLSGACTSAQAVRAADAIARDLEPGLAAWRVGTEDGCDAAGRSTRWELRYDLLRRRSELVITVGFTLEESSGRFRGAVAALRLVPFPAEGSELARMALAGEITGRRLRAVWRQQAREREPLPADFPDSAAVAAAVAPDPVRSAHARVTRLRGAAWSVETPGRTRHLRPDDLR